MPGDLSDCPLHGVGVLEDHDCLGGDSLGEVLGLFAAEVLFELVDLVVLLNALLGACDEVFGGLAETQLGVSVELLSVLGYVAGLGVVVVLGPTYLKNS